MNKNHIFLPNFYEKSQQTFDRMENLEKKISQLEIEMKSLQIKQWKTSFMDILYFCALLVFPVIFIQLLVEIIGLILK